MNKYIYLTLHPCLLKAFLRTNILSFLSVLSIFTSHMIVFLITSSSSEFSLKFLMATNRDQYV